MSHHSTMPPIEWAGRVNRSWLVRGGLNDRANEWLEHLEKEDGGRLLASCEAARAMCGMRHELEDPKPWFYAGLFSLATADEARRFLATHHATKAALPSMTGDEEVERWLTGVGEGTRQLVTQLREGMSKLPGGG